MPVLAMLSILVAGGLAWLLRGERDSDPPARIVAAAASRLPAHRQEWGQAMAAELTQIRGRARRWQFTAAVLRVVPILLPRHRNRALLAAASGLIIGAAATAATAAILPSLSVFTAVIGLLVTGYASLAASRSRGQRLTVPHLVASAVAIGGVAASITAVTCIAATHPAATADRTHVFSVLFAIILTCYLARARTPARPGDRTATVLWWGLSGALASGAVWTVAALHTPASAGGIAIYLWPVGAAVTLAVSISAAAACRSRRAGARAGMLTAILGAPMHFTIDLAARLHLQHYTLTSPYDIAAYPHSGYPDIASYVLGDAVGGDILTDLVLYPVTLLALVALGAAAGTGLRKLATKDTPHTA